MNFIDAHIHFWDLKYGINSWVINQLNTKLKKDFLPYKDKNRIGVIHVEAHDSVVPTIKEIEWLAKLMSATCIEYKHIAFADITQQPQDFAFAIDAIKDYPSVVGIRHILAHNQRVKYNPCLKDLSNNKNISENLLYLAENNLCFNCQIYPQQLDNILPKIKSSGVITLIDHMFLPVWMNINDQEGKMWSNAIYEIACIDNVYLKFSGLDMLQNEDKFKSVAHECLARFPVERILFGTNFPVSFTDDCNYWYKFVDHLIPTKKDKDMIFYKNALNLFFKS